MNDDGYKWWTLGAGIDRPENFVWLKLGPLTFCAQWGEHRYFEVHAMNRRLYPEQVEPWKR